MDAQIGNVAGVPACSNVAGITNLNGGASAQAALDLDNLDNVSAMRTRLTTIDAGFYTAARLNTLSYNDMMYAVRLADAANTIKQ